MPLDRSESPTWTCISVRPSCGPRPMRPQVGRTEMRVGLSGLPSGIYVLRLQAGGTTKTQKMTVVR